MQLLFFAMGTWPSTAFNVRQPCFDLIMGQISVCLASVQGMQPPEGLTEDQQEVWLRDAAFLSQLLDNTKVCACHFCTFSCGLGSVQKQISITIRRLASLHTACELFYAAVFMHRVWTNYYQLCCSGDLSADNDNIGPNCCNRRGRMQVWSDCTSPPSNVTVSATAFRYYVIAGG